MGQDWSVFCPPDQRYTIILTAVYFLASMRTVRGRGAGGGGGGGGAVEWTCEAPRPSQHPRSGLVSAGVGTDDNV